MEDEINLREYLAVVKKRWKMIVLFAIVGTLIAFFNASAQPKMYKATATLLPTDSGGGGLASALSALSFIGGGGGASGGEGKLIPLLKSRAVAIVVAKIIDIRSIDPALADNLKLSAEEKIQSAAMILHDAIDAKTGTTGLFEITATWKNPQIAALVANKYVEGLGKFLNAHALNINYQLIDQAVPPSSAFKPKVKESSMIGLALGLFIGIFLSFFQEYGKIAKQL